MTSATLVRTWENHLAGFPAVDLESLTEIADLQRRFDHKYLVPVTVLPDILEAMDGEASILEVAGRRTSEYESAYFDTPSFLTYRDHLQRRRRRYKIRTRHYGDAAAAMLEVKVKGRRGETIKHRCPHSGNGPDALADTDLDFVASVLALEYDLPVPENLSWSATTSFTRTTLVHRNARERVTVDRGLCVSTGTGRFSLGRSHAVVEVKSPVRWGPVARSLSQLGLRPERISKYCVGLSAAIPELRGNPWRPAIKRMSPRPLPVRKDAQSVDGA